MEPVVGVEPTTCSLQNCCSNQLSYTGMGSYFRYERGESVAVSRGIVKGGLSPGQLVDFLLIHLQFRPIF